MHPLIALVMIVVFAVVADGMWWSGYDHGYIAAYEHMYRDANR